MRARFGTVALTGIALLALGLVAASPAAAVYPAGKAFFGFWELNFGGTGPVFVADCIQFTQKQMCSLINGACGTFSITGEDLGTEGTTNTWTAKLDMSGFLGSGRVELNGVTERKGPGGSANAVGYLSRTPLRSNISIDLHEDPTCVFGPPFPARPGDPASLGSRSINEAIGAREGATLGKGLSKD
jgi:hypothetical protein